MAKYSASQNRAVQKYVRNNYDTIVYRMRKDSDLNKETLHRMAAGAGESVNEYITTAIRERMERKTKI